MLASVEERPSMKSRTASSAESLSKSSSATTTRSRSSAAGLFATRLALFSPTRGCLACGGCGGRGRFDDAESSRALPLPAAAVVRGLVHLHDERSIMHRDIKAGNILLSGADGGVKLCDLGVSAIPSCRSFRLPLVCTNSADHLHFLLPAPFLHSIQVCRPRSPITRSARR